MRHMEDLLQFLGAVNWYAAAVAGALLAVTVVIGLWLPGRLIEAHTRQAGARYIWYGVGGMLLIMVYISAYGYGWFWNSMADQEKADPFLTDKGRHTTLRH